MRNAILLADEQQGINGVDRALIWDVFASRGMGYAASAVDTDDVHPLQDFSRPPAPSSVAVGSVSGTVRDLNTGAPIPGALVAFAGHDSGLGEDLSTTTTATGTYRIDRVPAPRVWSFLTVAGARGYDRTSIPNVVVSARRRGHAQRHAPAQLGAGLRRHDGHEVDRTELLGLGLWPGLHHRRHAARRVEHLRIRRRLGHARAQGAGPRPARSRSRSAR